MNAIALLPRDTIVKALNSRDPKRSVGPSQHHLLGASSAEIAILLISQKTPSPVGPVGAVSNRAAIAKCPDARLVKGGGESPPGRWRSARRARDSPRPVGVHRPGRTCTACVISIRQLICR